jgi:CHAD domain-containing protein
MRVASRRLRSALRDFDETLGAKAVPQRRLREVAGTLGEVRDQDVAIAALEKVRKKAPSGVAEGITQLIGERDAVRARAREKLVAVIAESSLAELRERFLSRLAQVSGNVRRKKDAKGKGARRVGGEVSFRQTGHDIIEARVKELREFSNSLHHPFDIEPLHEMRIAAKRLRYALELFAPCWGGRLASCSREIAELQTSLGELRDCDLWIENLGKRLDRQRAEPKGERDAGAQVRLAAIWLLNHFTKERGKHFRRALTRWHKWETGGFFERMKETLRNRPEEPAGIDTPGDAVAGRVTQEPSPATQETSAGGVPE